MAKSNLSLFPLTDLGCINGLWKDILSVLLRIMAAEVAQKLAIQLAFNFQLNFKGEKSTVSDICCKNAPVCTVFTTPTSSNARSVSVR